MRSLPILPIALSLAACAPPAIDGGGTTTRGESIVGEIFVDPGGAGEHLFIRSPQGWVCRSVYTAERGRRFQIFRRDVPLACSTGSSGLAQMRFSGDRGWLDVEFELDDGTAGRLLVHDRS